jgi:hypothetical protein
MDEQNWKKSENELRSSSDANYRKTIEYPCIQFTPWWRSIALEIAFLKNQNEF